MKDELDKLVGKNVCVGIRTDNYYIGIVSGKLIHESEEYLVSNKKVTTRIGFVLGQITMVSDSTINVVYK